MDKFIEKLLKENSKYNNNIPALQDAEELLLLILGFLFPHFRSKKPLSDIDCYNIVYTEISQKLEETLQQSGCSHIANSKEIFLGKLESLYDTLLSDAYSILEGDPAAKSIDEVIITYPGFLAIAIHRIAHQLYQQDIVILPRLFSEYAHRYTGIDIHPGARIGRNFCIDHGTGIVIGETSEIKNNVKIYQGVTLGALSVEKSLADKKRHPTIEENVVIYANATILGGETTIGKNTIIGGNVWLTASVPENSMVYHSGETKIKQNSRALE